MGCGAIGRDRGCYLVHGSGQSGLCSYFSLRFWVIFVAYEQSRLCFSRSGKSVCRYG